MIPTSQNFSHNASVSDIHEGESGAVPCWSGVQT